MDIVVLGLVDAVSVVVVGWSPPNIIRTIKKAMYIRVNGPYHNRNIGKFQ